MAGLRVVRGPDWKWSNQDGGNGHVGTVEGGDGGKVKVIWDDGDKNSYRNGAEDAADLAVLDNGPAGVKHPGVQCDICSENNLRGIRWKCNDCHDYDLCTECYGNDKHDRSHKFKRFDKPESNGVIVGKRSSSEKTQARGTYVGAIVTRGPDWDKDDQDGGAGNAGVVVKVGYVQENGVDKAACVVKWPNSSTGRIYRLGLGGNVDVKFKIPAIGWGYYKDHLPALRDVSKVCDKKLGGLAEGLLGALGGLLAMHELLAGLTGDDDEEKESRKKETMKKFKVGDLVRLSDNLEEVTHLQDGHGGLNILMIGALGKVGVVRDIDDDGDLKINFGGLEWSINPAAVTKHAITTGASLTDEERKPSGRFKNGDTVIINKSESVTKSLQSGHGGWHDHMKQLIDAKTVGRVKEVDSDGDIRVEFSSEVSFLLNPEVCDKAKAQKDVNAGVQIPSMPARPKSSLLVSETPTVTPGSSQSTSRATGGRSSGPPSAATFHPGEQVRINATKQALKQNQKGHGGWNSKMEKVLGDIGLVEKVDKDGDIKVKFTNGTWVMNPRSFVSLHPTKSKPPDLRGSNTVNFQEGDEVRIDMDLDVVMALQQGHGGWNGAMNKVQNATGKVREVLSSGDIKVQYDSDTWTFNSAVLIVVKSRATGGSSHDQVPECPICMTLSISTIFNCGHGTCDSCSQKINECGVCRAKITIRTKLFI